MNYLVKRIMELPQEQKSAAMSELVAEMSAIPVTTTDKYVVSSMLDFTDAARERYKNFGKMQGLSSGYPSIDKLTKGFVGGEVTVIAGKTSYGKTTLAMNIANRVALQGHRVLFVTLEMTKVELTSRYIHINGGENDDYLKVAANTIFQENDELTWEDVDGLIENAKKQLDVSLVVIDHLHYFTRELQNVAEDLGRITKEFSKNANRHDMPIILISHVRKTGKGDAATMEDLRGSSFIGQDSDVVLMVGRNEDFPDQMLVKIEKNRNRGVEFGDGKDLAKLHFDKTKLTEEFDISAWNTSAPS